MLSKNLLATLPCSIRVLRKMFSEYLQDNMTQQHFRVLYLANEGMGPTQMAETMQISMAAVSKVVNCATLNSYLEKTTGKDRRSVILKLTPKGKKVLNSISKRVEKRLDLVMRKLSPEEKEELIQGIVVLDKLMHLMKEG